MNAKIGLFWIGETMPKIGNVSVSGQSIHWSFVQERAGPVTAETPLHVYVNGTRLFSCLCGDESAEVPFYLAGMDGDLLLVPDGVSPVHDGYVNSISAQWDKVVDASAYNTYVDGEQLQVLGSEAVSYTTPVLESGPHTLSISSLDRYGNESALSSPLSAVVYPLPPAPQEYIFTVESGNLMITPASGTVENENCRLRIYTNYFPISASISDEIEERFPLVEIDLSSAVFPLSLLEVGSIDTAGLLFRAALVLDGRETKNALIQSIDMFKLSAPYDLHIAQLTDGSGNCSVRWAYDWTTGKLCKRFEIRAGATVLYSMNPAKSDFVEGYVIPAITITSDTDIQVAAVSEDGTAILSEKIRITLDTTAPAKPTLRRSNW